MDKDLYRNMKMVWYSNKFLFDLLEDSFRFLKIRPVVSVSMEQVSIYWKIWKMFLFQQFG